MRIINRKIIIFFVVIAVVLFVVFRTEGKDTTGKYTVQRQNMDLIIETSGYVESNAKAELFFQVAEKVTDVYVSEGDVVEKDTILATVSSESLAQSSQVARDNKDIAEFEKDLFIEKYSTNLSAIGGEDEYYRQLRIYDENISKASALYNQSLINNKKSLIIAPFDGTVSKVYVNEGDLSSLAKPALEIQNTSNPTLYTKVSEVDIAYVDVNDKVEIIFEAFPDKIFTGYVYSINPVAENVQGIAYYKAEIRADDLPEKLRVGMSADINILAETKENVLYVPLYLLNSVTTDSGAVDLESKDGVTQIDVKIGLNNYKGVEVISGLNEGDVIIYSKDEKPTK